MINRIRERFEEPQDEAPVEDYWEVMGDAGWFTVTAETAREVSRHLAAPLPPRWLRFTDLFGAEVQVRSKGIDCVRECSLAPRAAERSFRRARRDEREADGRPWDDDEGF
ncbi:MAG: hypothetical protein FIA95_08125 [Gemmatimonadetes bacterium]|nr:hypothetical protein [Gemmatimonadota bacterium]